MSDRKQKVQREAFAVMAMDAFTDMAMAEYVQWMLMSEDKHYGTCCLPTLGEIARDISPEDLAMAADCKEALDKLPPLARAAVVRSVLAEVYGSSAGAPQHLPRRDGRSRKGRVDHGR